MNDQQTHPYSNSNLVPQDVNAISFVLRDDTRLFLVRPAPRSAKSIPLEPEGSYLCISLAGEPVVEQGAGARPLAPNRLHILRQPADAPIRRIEFPVPTTLAVVAFVSSRWCSACSRGPGCKVAQFLLRGNQRPAADQTIDLDERGLAVARTLLGAHIDEDIDVLAVEQSLLALLSWAFVKDSGPGEVATAKTSLHPQAAMKVRQAADILRQRFDDPPTIAQLSVSVGLNESDLKRCFKCLYGDSIANYSRQRRLDVARDLLMHSALGVAAVALEVGFSNPSQFARAFRQQFGINPSEYRRSPH